ncbi:MAG TPA: hypothetical protein VKI65_06670, partial [Gemmataceae bacterium]|nr:hypothetical protein [Gemmataceae bacterium]
MLLRMSCLIVMMGAMALLGASTVGQEKEAPPEKKDAKGQIKQADESYRRFFKAPQTTLEYWAAIKFEIEVGKFDLAAEHLKGLLAAKPSDEDLLTIEEAEGMSAFLRLERIPKWSDDPKVHKEAQQNARELIRRVSTALQKKLNDPDRIKKYIKNLSASPEEREFAIVELQRSGAVAVPHLLNEFRQAQDAATRGDIASVLPLLRRDAVPPLIAGLDIDDPALKVELIKVLRQRTEKGAVPYLWHLTTADKELPLVRSTATAATAELLGVAPDKLPQAKVALTHEAERYYRHQVRFPNALATRRLDAKQAAAEVIIWRWDGKQLVSESRTESQAEEYYGLRFARQALELDPAYQPAQLVFLSMALDKGYERGGIDKPLSTAAPTVRELLATVNPDLLIAVLERALEENRLPVILGTVQALGDLAEVRATKASGFDAPPLVKALNYSDRRVQFAAADALLRIPGNRPQAVSSQIVEVLRRALAGDAAPKAAVGDFNNERGMAIADAVREAGFEPVVVRTGRDLVRRLNQASDVDVVMVDHQLPDPGLHQLVAELRADVHFGRLPLLITIAPEPAGAAIDPNATTPGALRRRLLSEQAQVRQRFTQDQTEQQLRRLAEKYSNTWVMPATLDSDVLKETLSRR